MLSVQLCETVALHTSALAWREADKAPLQRGHCGVLLPGGIQNQGGVCAHIRSQRSVCVIPNATFESVLRT